MTISANLDRRLVWWLRDHTAAAEVKAIIEFAMANTTGTVYFVHSGTGSDADEAGKRPGTPFATLNYAINQCTASKGDIVFLMPGHAETVSAAGGIAIDVVGVTVVNLGRGASAATFTFSATAATITMTAASCSLLGFPILTPSIDSVVSPVVVSAANCELQIRAKDASSTVEFVRSLLTTAAADDLNAHIEYRGDTGGNAVVNVVRLVGGNNVRIHLDAHGVFSTAAVEFLTTACTNVVVTGYVFNSGTTDGTKLVVDTQGSSTWYAKIEDGAAGAVFSGGSASALASDDVSAINTKIGTITNTAGTATVGAILGDFANDSLVARLNDIGSNVDATTTDSIQGKLGTDTELADRSVFDLLAGDGPASAPAGAAPGNDVSLYEVARDTWDAIRNGTGGTEPGTNKSIVDAIGFDGAAAVASTAGMLRTAAGTRFILPIDFTSSAIPNNTQTSGDITGAASGNILVEAITLETDATGIAGPTNLEISTDNAKGLTGAGAPHVTTAVSGLGANKTVNIRDAASEVVPFVLESTKKIYVHGDDLGGSGGGVTRITLHCVRMSDGASLAAGGIGS